MSLEEVRHLRNLNVELLRDLLATLHSVDSYCDRNGIQRPYDPNISESVRKALAVIQEINGSLSSPAASAVATPTEAPLLTTPKTKQNRVPGLLYSGTLV